MWMGGSWHSRSRLGIWSVWHEWLHVPPWTTTMRSMSLNWTHYLWQSPAHTLYSPIQMMCAQKYSCKTSSLCFITERAHFTAKVTVWADFSDRGKDSRQCYIHSICSVSQPVRQPNCAKSHIGISCHGYYSLSLIWFDCQGDSWMPKVFISNHLTLLKWITTHMLCACQDLPAP